MAHTFETIAAFRYGYGFAQGTQDVRDVDGLMAQIDAPDLGLAQFHGPDFTDRSKTMRQFLAIRKQLKKGDESKRPMFRAANKKRKLLKADDMRRVFQRAMFVEQGFRERLVFFWADHFTVSPKSRFEKVLWGNYQEAAIRPHVGGTFGDMLVGAVTHPSMLLFLDQVKSIGPKSKAGKKQKRGLNENLAREVLELHTMGVGGGYKQSDVRQLAELLTGLIVDHNGASFNPNRAEPGHETVLGRDYGGNPARQAAIEEFLQDVAVHPDTARHICSKLVVHFISDEPDEKLVDDLARVYLRTGGDLPTVYGAMLDRPEAWVDLGQKAKQPFDFVVSGFRALGISRDLIAGLTPTQVNRFLHLPLLGMGQPLIKAPGPNGWPEEAEAWITAQGLASRLQWALSMSSKFGEDHDPREFVDANLRELAGGTLKFAVSGAEQRAEGLTLVLGSPEFNRR